MFVMVMVESTIYRELTAYVVEVKPDAWFNQSAVPRISSHGPGVNPSHALLLDF